MSIRVAVSLQAFLTLCFAFGIKRAIERVITHPALVLTPAISFWTYGPVKSVSCCAYRRFETKICLSFRLTWVNAILSLCGTFGMVALNETLFARQPWKSSFSYSQEFPGFINNLLLISPVLSWFVVAYLPLFAISTICLLLIQFMDKCSPCCCRSCNHNCFPMTEKIVFDTEMSSL